MTKNIIFFISGIVVTLVVVAIALTFVFIPDKNDWLELVLSQKIQTSTDFWEKRYAVRVTVFDETNEIVVTVATANDEEPSTPTQVDSAESQIKSIIDIVLEEYNWLEDYEVAVAVF